MKNFKLIGLALGIIFCAVFPLKKVLSESRPPLIASKAICKPIKVMTTLEIHKAIVEELVGDGVEVEALIPPGLSPCKFDPIPSDRRKLEACDLWIGSKQFFESKASNNPAIQRFICVHKKSPHEVMSPECLKKSTCQIAEALKELVPNMSASIDRNRDAFLNKIDLTVARVKEILALSSKPKLLSLHPTFSSFCEFFGIEHLAVENCHGGASLKRIEHIKSALKPYQVTQASGMHTETPILIVEPFVESEQAKRIAQTLEVEVRLLDPYKPDVLCTYLELAKAAAR